MPLTADSPIVKHAGASIAKVNASLSDPANPLSKTKMAQSMVAASTRLGALFGKTQQAPAAAATPAVAAAPIGRLIANPRATLVGAKNTILGGQ